MYLFIPRHRTAQFDLESTYERTIEAEEEMFLVKLQQKQEHYQQMKQGKQETERDIETMAWEGNREKEIEE